MSDYNEEGSLEGEGASRRLWLEMNQSSVETGLQSSSWPDTASRSSSGKSCASVEGGTNKRRVETSEDCDHDELTSHSIKDGQETNVEPHEQNIDRRSWNSPIHSPYPSGGFQRGESSEFLRRETRKVSGREGRAVVRCR